MNRGLRTPSDCERLIQKADVRHQQQRGARRPMAEAVLESISARDQCRLKGEVHQRELCGCPPCELRVSQSDGEIQTSRRLMATVRSARLGDQATSASG